MRSLASLKPPMFSLGLWEVVHSPFPLHFFRIFLGLFKEFEWETRRRVRVSVRTEAGMLAGMFRSRLEARMHIRLMIGTRRTGHGRLRVRVGTLVGGKWSRWLKCP